MYVLEDRSIGFKVRAQTTILGFRFPWPPKREVGVISRLASAVAEYRSIVFAFVSMDKYPGNPSMASTLGKHISEQALHFQIPEDADLMVREAAKNIILSGPILGPIAHLIDQPTR